MLTEQQKHGEYQKFVTTWLDIVYPQGPPSIHAHVATMIMLVNLTPMRKIVQHLYSVLGRPARAPERMLRSLLVMVLSGLLALQNGSSKCEVTLSIQSSVVFTLSMFLAFVALSFGNPDFPTQKTGTFYDFINLLMFRKHKDGRGLSQRKKKPEDKSKPHTGIIRRLADRLLEGKNLPLKFSAASIIKEIFQTIFVAHSEELSLISEPLTVSGSGADR